jgi:hypothetical protein
MELERGSAEINQGQGESSNASVAQLHVASASPGQPTKDYERTEFCHIQLDATLMDYLRSLGGSDLSKGVTIATRFHQSMHGAEK